MAIKDSVAKLSEVKSVEYVSADKALEDFKAKHKRQRHSFAIHRRVGQNPLGAGITIIGKEISHYGSVAKFLVESKSDSSGDSIIDKVNYFCTKIIDRLSNYPLIRPKIGFDCQPCLTLVSILVSFNTIRLAIYSSRDEIEVMRLVGASNRFASGPFIVERGDMRFLGFARDGYFLSDCRLG